MVLSASEVQQLLDALALRERTLVLLDVGTGLRMSELFGLKWKDVDFDAKEISVVRSIVMQVTGPCKTESSQKPIPLDPYLAEALRAWLEHVRYNRPEDWVFANPRMKGRQPYWGQEIMRRVIRPIAIQLGITKHIGWHTFRHTYSTLLQGGHQSHAGTAQARLQPGHDGHIYTSSHGTKTQSAEWSDSFDPRPRYGACNWGVSESAPFCAYEKTTNLGKCSCGTAGRTDLAVLLFLFVPAKNRRCSSKLLKRLGVPDGI